MNAQVLAEAREAMDRALAARPKLDGQALTEATKALCRRRDALRHRSREGADPAVTAELRVVNGLISLVQAAHFPIGATPWPLLERARIALSATPSL